MTVGLTRIPGVPDSEDVQPGMAYFPGTGPEGKTCGSCAHRGYTRESSSGKAYSVAGCMKFKRMTGRYGPAVGSDWRACKYYEVKSK